VELEEMKKAYQVLSSRVLELGKDNAAMKTQLEETTRANLVARQECDTLRAELKSVSGRLNRVETRSDVVGLANSVSHASAAASLAAPESRKTSFFLFTGMREAMSWDDDEEEDMRNVLTISIAIRGSYVSSDWDAGSTDTMVEDDLCWQSTRMNTFQRCWRTRKLLRRKE
jgi:hypothetical protein